jgi:hypothetical protein
VISIFGNVFNNFNFKIYAYGFGDCLTKDEITQHLNDYELSNNNFDCYFNTFDEVFQR